MTNLELAVFHEFLPHCPLPIVEVERREPQEPDILCRLKDGSEIAFEITESIDEDLARAHREDLETSQWLQKRAEDQGLPGGVLYAIDYHGNTSRAARRRAADSLLDELRRIPSDFTGNWSINDERLRSLVRRLGVSRGNWTAVEFQIPAVAWIKDPIMKRIKDKSTKKYQTHAPIHLLVYYDGQPRCFDPKEPPNSQFERVWVFDRRSKQVWSFPHQDPTENQQYDSPATT